MAPGPERQQQRYYGRRHGRALRPGRRRLLRELLPRLRIDIDAEGGPVDPNQLFDFEARAIWLEIGSGSGEHVAWQAERAPDFGFIAAEPYINGVASLLSRIATGKLRNIRILPDDVRPLLKRLPGCSIDRIFVLFPDPWPKARHRDRRLISRDTLDELARIMRPGAELRLATDDMGYLRWMLRHLVDHPDFEWLARRPNDWRARPKDWPQTRYELKTRREGRDAAYLRFRRK
ncbi:MAG: tRNA (guanine(46)-N(7))-methyltransferase TrmB [Alphaproteobacteria bacterium]